jgi:NADPH:quinone reductase
MKAIQAADHGGYDALRLVDIPQPQPRAGQALVRVTSAGVTPLVYRPGRLAPACGGTSARAR